VTVAGARKTQKNFKRGKRMQLENVKRVESAKKKPENFGDGPKTCEWGVKRRKKTKFQPRGKGAVSTATWKKVVRENAKKKG